MSKTVIDNRVSGPARLRRTAGAGWLVFSFLLLWLLASALVHPLPHEALHRASTPLLLGAQIPQPVADVLTHACINCHSEQTRWPWYSHVAPVSWLVEWDVKLARERMNFSHWDRLDSAEQRSRLTAIATVIENREMPLHKYVVFHPDVKLSADDSVRVIEWTHSERRRLRASLPTVTAK